MAALAGKRSATFIDMTPMVDLAFLLLTFFVLTTNLNKAWNLEIDMPLKEKVTKAPLLEHTRALHVVLGSQNKIYWYMGMPGSQAEVTDFSAHGIRKVIAEKKTTVKDLVILIKPSDQSQYKNVIDILDEMIIAEHTGYTMVDLEPEDRKLIADVLNH
jgi:biopolymer transport protein ExbD